jgi:DNA/RNA-binding protein KIN17
MYIFICFLFIQEVNDLYRAVIKMVDSGDKIRVDQSHLETVIPAQGMHIILVAICIQI